MATGKTGTKADTKVWMHSLHLSDKTKAAELFMPFIRGGGIFIATEQRLFLGDSVFVLLTIGEDGVKLPINGKVVWVNGEDTRGDRPRGVGLQLPNDPSGVAAKEAIEEMIGKMQDSLKKTATL